MDKNVDIGKRLEKFATDNYKTLTAFASALGVALQSLRTHYFSGQSIPGGIFLSRLAAMGCDINWLLTGKEKEENNFILKEAKELGYNVKKIRTFPIVSQLSAGDVRVYFEDNEIEDFITLPYSHSNCVALKVVGDSMSPKIDEGDLILIDFYADTKPGDIVAVRLKNGSQLLKRYLQSKSSFVFLYSDNNKYPPMVIHQKEVELIYKVVKIIKDV